MLRFVLAVVWRPRVTLALTLLITAACILLAVTRLRISADQNKLFSKEVPFFRDFLQFNKEFPENEALYVIIEAKDKSFVPPTARWTAAADAIVTRLSTMRGEVVSATARIDPEALGAQGLLFETPAQLHAEVERVREFVPLMQLVGQPPNLLTQQLGSTPLERLLTSLSLQPPDPDTARFANLVVQSLNQTFAAPAVNGRTPPPVLPDLSLLGSDTPQRQGYVYLPDQTDPSRHVLLVRVQPREDYTSLTAQSETIEAIRDAVAEAAKPFGEFDVGLTGRPALEADEMRTTDTDSTRAEIVALSAVFVGIVLLLRSVWLTFAAELALGVGIAWTFGWATVTLGELNLLSIVFMLALIGIGMDYLIQILSRYRREAAVRHNPRRIWVAVFRQVSAPINTATLGAAGAFLVSLLTGFAGAASLGLIAGGGLILCLLSGYTFLPALLTIWPVRGRNQATAKARWREGKREEDKNNLEEGEVESAISETILSTSTSPSSISPLPSSSGFPSRLRAFAVDSFGTRARAPLLWLVLLAIGIPFALRTRFDAGLLNLQAPNLRSVQLIRKLETWSAVVLSKDVSALRAARASLSGAKTVDHTESLLDASDNYLALTNLTPPLPDVEWTTPASPVQADLARLADKAEGLANAWEKAGKTRNTTAPVASQLPTTIAAMRSLASKLRAGDSASLDWLAQWQVGFVDELKEMLAAFHPSPPDYTVLPPELKNHLVSPDGTFALYIYPKEDLWDQAALERFVDEIEPRIMQTNTTDAPLVLTGIAHNISHSTAAIRASFIRSTLLALALIVLLVFLDLRRMDQTLIAISVLALGLPMLVALMGVFGIDWNFANFFGLPILIGAGHEYGVFLVHRYREAERSAASGRRAWRGWDVTDAALLLCAFVTSSSFGFFFLLAHHQGLRSLGLVMALGSACIYLASVVVVRPILKAKLAAGKVQAGSAETTEPAANTGR